MHNTTHTNRHTHTHTRSRARTLSLSLSLSCLALIARRKIKQARLLRHAILHFRTQLFCQFGISRIAHLQRRLAQRHEQRTDTVRDASEHLLMRARRSQQHGGAIKCKQRRAQCNKISIHLLDVLDDFLFVRFREALNVTIRDDIGKVQVVFAEFGVAQLRYQQIQHFA